MRSEQLTTKALQALEEVARQARDGPAAPSFALRFVLAYLYSVGAGDRWLFDGFWREATRPIGAGVDRGAAAIVRSQTVNACLNGIYRSVGAERTAAMQFPELAARAAVDEL